MFYNIIDCQDETTLGEQETFTAADLYNLEIEAIPTIVSPIIPSQGLWAIVGSSDTGKSMLLRQLALAIGKGENCFLGFNLNTKYNKVIYIATEDNNINTAVLLRKQSTSVEGLENIRFNFEVDDLIPYLIKQLVQEPADLIIIDSWSDVFRHNLNDTALIRQELNKFNTICTRFNCSIGFLHHTGKRTQKLAPSKDNILSGQGFEAKMRLVLELRNDSIDQNYKHLCVVKGNYLGPDLKIESYKLKFDPTTFLFEYTGERIHFSALVDGTNRKGAENKQAFRPGELSLDTHQALLRKMFEPGWQPKLAELKNSLVEVYNAEFNTGLGGKRLNVLLNYLIDDLKLISKNGKDRSPTAFYYLTTDHPLT